MAWLSGYTYRMSAPVANAGAGKDSFIVSADSNDNRGARSKTEGRPTWP
jgi:hypothetical protein